MGSMSSLFPEGVGDAARFVSRLISEFSSFIPSGKTWLFFLQEGFAERFHYMLVEINLINYYDCFILCWTLNLRKNGWALFGCWTSSLNVYGLRLFHTRQGFPRCSVCCSYHRRSRFSWRKNRWLADKVGPRSAELEKKLRHELRNWVYIAEKKEHHQERRVESIDESKIE